MNSSRTITILLLLAMGLTLLPAPLNATYYSSSSSDDNPCETSRADACDGEACGTEPVSEGDNCCEAGCQHCSLPCCSGTVMLPTITQGLSLDLTPDGRGFATAIDLPWVDTDPLDHPPRG